MIAVFTVCHTIAPVFILSPGLDLSTRGNVRLCARVCVRACVCVCVREREGLGGERGSAVVSLHWISFRTFLIGGFSRGRC